MVKFVSYNGKYPCLCFGELIVEIDGKEVNLGNCLSSGGSVWFDDEWDEHIEGGPWDIDEYELPEEYKKYYEEIKAVVNENVPQGCCGGCI